MHWHNAYAVQTGMVSDIRVIILVNLDTQYILHYTCAEGFALYSASLKSNNIYLKYSYMYTDLDTSTLHHLMYVSQPAIHRRVIYPNFFGAQPNDKHPSQQLSICCPHRCHPALHPSSWMCRLILSVNRMHSASKSGGRFTCL